MYVIGYYVFSSGYSLSLFVEVARVLGRLLPIYGVQLEAIRVRTLTYGLYGVLLLRNG